MTCTPMDGSEQGKVTFHFASKSLTRTRLCQAEPSES
jgi:hypothetical protein